MGVGELKPAINNPFIFRPFLHVCWVKPNDGRGVAMSGIKGGGGRREGP